MLQAAAPLSLADEGTDLEEDDCENKVAPVSAARALTDRLAAGDLGLQAGEALQGLTLGPMIATTINVLAGGVGHATW